MDEPRLRQLLHDAFDPIPPMSDPFRLVREAGTVRRRARHGPIAIVAGAWVSVLFIVLLLVNHQLANHPAQRIIVQQTARVAIPPPPTEVAQTAAVASEYPTPGISAWNHQYAVASVGDEIVRTGDAGRTWVTVFTGRADNTGNIRDLEWVTYQTAFAVANYGLLRSDDAGFTWRLINGRRDLRRLDFVSSTEGYVVAGADARGKDWQLLRTANGGSTFALYPVGLPSVTWVQWVSQTRAWVAGPGGLLTTTDGGDHWQAQLGPRSSRIVDAQIGMVDESRGFAYFRGLVTSDGQRSSWLYYTADGGHQWLAREVPDTLLPYHDDELVVTGASSAEIVMQSALDAGMLRCATADGARSWKCLPLSLPAQAPARVVARGPVRMVIALDSRQVVIASSEDGGASWTAVNQLDASRWIGR